MLFGLLVNIYIYLQIQTYVYVYIFAVYSNNMLYVDLCVWMYALI